MAKRCWPLDLDYYSSLIGKNIYLVQGPGGNTSFKDGKTMWVKASGTKLADAEQKTVFVGVNISTGKILENSEGLRPSIEKDFHLLIPFTYVIHTHSLNAISLAIENRFGSKANDYPEIAFIPYARPGRDLSNMLRKKLDFGRHKAAILQNHGFITWGESMADCYELLMTFENAGQAPYSSLEDFDEQILKLEHPRAVTPDYAVFLSQFSEEEIMNFKNENLWKKQMFLVTQKAAGAIDPHLGVNYLASDETLALQNWELEKFRMAIYK